MPVYLPSLEASGLTTADLQPTFHILLPAELNLSFLLHAGPLGDIVPYPIPPLNNVTSIGDVFIAIGLGWFLFATLVWGEISEKPIGVALWRGRPQPLPTDRPVVLGGGIGPGLVPPSAELMPDDATAAAGVAGDGTERLPLGQRIRQHPYVRLARDARFSAFWTGPDDQPVRGPAEPGRDRRARTDDDRVGVSDRTRLLRGDAAQPACSDRSQDRSSIAGIRSA